jgi:hypothetical protein
MKFLFVSSAEAEENVSMLVTKQLHQVRGVDMQTTTKPPAITLIPFSFPE